jgi:hypothetical protein
VIAAYILIQTKTGKAAVVAAALRAWRASRRRRAWPDDVIARAQARDTGEPGKLAASRVQVLGGVTRTMSCPMVHL